MSLEEKLKNLRKQHNFSQQEFADMLHVSRQAVSRWETGRAEPDIEMLRKISQLYKITIDDLINDEKENIVKADSLPDEIRYSEYWEYLESLNLSIMLLTSVVTIAIPYVGVIVDIVIILQLLKMKKGKNRLLFIILTIFILLVTSYNTYSAIIH